MLSDSDSSDSDNGIRFKTASTRNKDGSYGGSRTGSNINNHSSSKHYNDRSDGHWRHSTSSRTSDHRYSPDRKKYERRSSDISRRRRSESYERRRNHSRSKDKCSYSSSNNRVYERKRSRSKEYNHHHHHHHHQHQQQQQQQRNDNNKNDNIKDVINKSDNVKTISPKSINIATDKILNKQHKSKKSKHKKHKKSKREEKSIDKSLKIKSVEKNVVTTVTVPILETTSNDGKFITEKSMSLLESVNLNELIDKDDNNTVCGPSLPPNFKTRKSSRSPSSKISPPSRLLSTIITTTTTTTNYSTTSCSSTSTIIPHNDDQIEHLMSDISDDSESDDFNLIGPLPPGLTSNSESVLQLEKRALEIKLAKLNYDNNDEQHSIVQQHREREVWMTELPDIKSVADFGVTSRQFRVKERPDFGDRTSWTDTPNEKLRKQSHKVNSSGSSNNGSSSSTTNINNSENDKQIKYSHDELRLIKQKEANALFNAKRDAEQEQQHKRKHKRDESLLDMHRKKLKIRKEESDKKSKRRPFCRETDLKVNQFDKKQKNSIIKKAQLLDSRFGRGESKYL